MPVVISNSTLTLLGRLRRVTGPAIAVSASFYSGCSRSGRFRMTFSIQVQIMAGAMTMMSLMSGRLRWYEF